MQFSSEFEWISPSGRGLLTHYMPAHYSAGWWMDSSATLEEAETATYELFASLKKVALTRNVLLPVGTDYTPPNKWVTEIHRDWNERYTWPRFVCGLPREFFASVRAELDERGIAAVAADPRHEPDLHRQGRLLHRHQAGQPGRRERGAGRRALRRVRRAARRRHLSAGRAGEGLGAAGLRRTPRRHHRLGVRPGVPRPADRLARRVGAGPRGARQCARPDLQRRRGIGGGVEHVDAQANRRGDGAAGRAARRRCAGARRRRQRAARTGRARRPIGQLAGARRPVAGLARLPPGRWVGVDGLGTRGRQRLSRDRQRALPAAGRPGPRRCGVVADRRRPRTSRRRQGSATSWRSTTSTRHTRTRARARGTCCPRGRWSSRPAPPPSRCSATAHRWASGWSFAGGSVRCCATPRR